MKRPSDRLFHLIKSLTKSEKAYIGKMARRYTRGKQNNYLKLFYAIDKQKHYDEESLKAELHKEKFLTYLPRVKNFLTVMILDCLSAKHSGNRVQSSIRSLLSQCELLADRGLFDHCLSLYGRAKALARRHSLNSYYLEILYREIQTLRRAGYSDKKSIDRSYASLKTLRKVVFELQQQLEYYEIYVQLNDLVNENWVSSDNEASGRIAKLLADPLLGANSEDLPRDAQQLYIHIKLTEAYYLQNKSLMMHYSRKMLEFDLAMPELLRIDPLAMLHSLSAHTDACIRLQKFKEAGQLVERIGSLSLKASALKAHAFVKYYTHKIRLLGAQVRLREAEQLIPEIEAGISCHIAYLTCANLHALYLNLAKVNLYLAQHSQALHWLNKILHDPHCGHTSRYFYCYMSVLSAILHFELNNIDYLPRALRLVDRYSENGNILQIYDRAILRFLGQVPAITGGGLLQRGLCQLQGQVMATDAATLQKGVGGFFDCLSWLESKTSGETMLHILRRKARCTKGDEAQRGTEEMGVPESVSEFSRAE